MAVTETQKQEIARRLIGATTYTSNEVTEVIATLADSVETPERLHAATRELLQVGRTLHVAPRSLAVGVVHALRVLR